MDKKFGGCGGGDRELEMVFWPRVDELKEEKWVNAIIGILPKIHDIKKVYQSWERLSWNEQKNVESKIKRSAETEGDGHVRQNFRLTSYMITAFKKWSMIQEQRGAPGCDVDVTCLSVRSDNDLTTMITIIQHSIKIIKEDKEARRKRKESKDKRFIRSVVKTAESETELGSINVTVRQTDDRRIVHDLDAGGDTIPNEFDKQQSVVISPRPKSRLNSSSSTSSASKTTSSESSEDDSDDSESSCDDILSAETGNASSTLTLVPEEFEGEVLNSDN